MSTLPDKHYTLDEYFELERTHEERFEYFHGEIFAMVGATQRHNTITLNMASGIHQQLRGRDCQAFVSDMRVKISALHYAYPDITVVCGIQEIDPKPLDTLLNPTLIIEVLSPSTLHYAKNSKLQAFRSIPSLQEYILVAQDHVYVEQYTRQSDKLWLFHETDTLTDRLDFTSLGCQLLVGDVYERVMFGE